MRSVRVLRNVVTNYLRFFLSGLVAFLLTPILVHLLGDGDYGLWVTVFSLTGYFGLFDQGIRPSLVRYVSRDHARGDHEGIARTLSSALGLNGALGVLIVLLTLVAAATFTRFLKIEPAQVESARTIILIAGASLALGFPLGVFGAALSGLQRYDIANAIGIGIALVRAFAFVGVLRAGGGLVGLAWASLAMNLLGHFLSWVFVRRLLPQVRLGAALVTRTHLALIGSYSGFAFLGALANSIALQTDALVIAGFLGAAYVTPFAIAAGLVDNVRSLVFSATWVLSPTASELETHAEVDKLHAMVIAGAKYSVLVSWPVLWAIIVFGPNLLTAWVGARFVEPGPGFGPALMPPWDGHRWASTSTLITLLAVPTLVSLPQSAAVAVLFGVSRHKGVVGLSLLSALINLVLSLLWVKPLKLMGVALGTAVPLALVSGVLVAVYTCRTLELPLARYLREGMLRPGLVSLAFLAPALAVQALWRPAGWWALGAAVGGCWVVFVVVAWRWGADAAERQRWGAMVPGLFRPRAPAGVGR